MTNKLKYFIGNWKMFGDFSNYKIIQKIDKFANNTKKLFKKKKIVLCIPNTLIFNFSSKLKSRFISLGAQNCHHHNSYGPFTGSVSAKMLKNAGARFVILGHSENRAEGETPKLIKKKIISSLNEKLTVIFCIGETLHQKKRKMTFSTLRKQIKSSLEKNFLSNRIIIAYEPVWSIGSNKIPKANELRSVIQFIKKDFKNIFNYKKPLKVLYGGSVNDKNIRMFTSISELDGFLIGGASHSSKKFIDIIKKYYK